MTFIQKWCSSTNWLKALTIVLPIVIILHIVALSLPDWKTRRTQIKHLDTEEGLWKRCSPNACKPYDNVKRWLEACRTFVVITLLILIATWILALVKSFIETEWRKFLSTTICVLIGGAITTCLLTLVIFAVGAGMDGLHIGYDVEVAVALIVICCEVIAFFERRHY